MIRTPERSIPSWRTVGRFDWQWTAIRLNTRAALQAAPANLRAFLADERTVPGSAEGTPLADRVGHSLDFWWMYLYYLGVWPRWAATLAAASPLTAAAALLTGLYRRTVWPV